MTFGVFTRDFVRRLASVCAGGLVAAVVAAALVVADARGQSAPAPPSCELGQNPTTNSCECPQNSAESGGVCACDSGFVHVLLGDDAGTCQPSDCENGKGLRKPHGGCACPDGQTALAGSGDAAGFCVNDELRPVAQACEDSRWGIAATDSEPGYLFCNIPSNGYVGGHREPLEKCRIGTRANNPAGRACADIFDLSADPPFPQKGGEDDNRKFVHNCPAGDSPEVLNRNGETECADSPPCGVGEKPFVVGDDCDGCPDNGRPVRGACACNLGYLHVTSGANAGTCRPLQCGGSRTGYGLGVLQPDDSCACPEGRVAITGDHPEAGLCVPASVHSVMQDCASKGWRLGLFGEDSASCNIGWKNESDSAMGNGCHVTAPGATFPGGAPGEIIPDCADVFGDPPVFPRRDILHFRNFVYNCGAGMFPETVNLHGETACASAPFCNIGDNPTDDSCICPANSAAPSGGACACDANFTHVTSGDDAGTCMSSTCEDGLGDRQPDGSCQCPDGRTAIVATGHARDSWVGFCVDDALYPAAQACETSGWGLLSGQRSPSFLLCGIVSTGVDNEVSCEIRVPPFGLQEYHCANVFGDPPTFPEWLGEGDERVFAHNCDPGMIPAGPNRNGQTECSVAPPCALGDNPETDECHPCPANSGAADGVCACDADYAHVTSGDNAGSCQPLACGGGGITQPDGRCACPADVFNFRYDDPLSPAICAPPSVSDLTGAAAVSVALALAENCPAETALNTGVNEQGGADVYLTCGSAASPLVTLTGAADSGSGSHVRCVIAVRGTLAASVTGPACADIAHAGNGEKFYDREAGMYSQRNPFFYGECAGNNVLESDPGDANYGTCQPCPSGTVRDGFVCAKCEGVIAGSVAKDDGTCGCAPGAVSDSSLSFLNSAGDACVSRTDCLAGEGPDENGRTCAACADGKYNPTPGGRCMTCGDNGTRTSATACACAAGHAKGASGECVFAVPRAEMVSVAARAFTATPEGNYFVQEWVGADCVNSAAAVGGPDDMSAKTCRLSAAISADAASTVGVVYSYSRTAVSLATVPSDGTGGTLYATVALSVPEELAAGDRMSSREHAFIVAVPAPGYRVTDWGGSCKDSPTSRDNNDTAAKVCVIAPGNDDLNVTATFTPVGG